MPSKNLRLTPEAIEGFDRLATAMEKQGQRGATLQPMIEWIGRTAHYEPDLMLAALTFVQNVAAGGEEREELDMLEDAVDKILSDLSDQE